MVQYTSNTNFNIQQTRGGGRKGQERNTSDRLTPAFPSNAMETPKHTLSRCTGNWVGAGGAEERGTVACGSGVKHGTRVVEVCLSIDWKNSDGRADDELCEWVRLVCFRCVRKTPIKITTVAFSLFTNKPS